jgi:hypothetical protein
MFARCLLSLVLAISATGCGRVRTYLLQTAAAAGATSPKDASAGTDGGADAASYHAPIANNVPIDALDAAVADSGLDAGSPPARCAGTQALGLCWYLGAPSTSCNAACATHGGFDTRAIGHVGTRSQGGRQRDCAEILTALSQPGAVVTATRSDELGFGCHVWPDGTRFWLDDPSPLFKPSIAAPSDTPVRIACGCMR